MTILTRLLHDVISYANEINVPLAVISVDQMKAFDRGSHPFLSKTLQIIWLWSEVYTMDWAHLYFFFKLS